jgi:hypothetical protein
MRIFSVFPAPLSFFFRMLSLPLCRVPRCVGGVFVSVVVVVVVVLGVAMIREAKQRLMSESAERVISKPNFCCMRIRMADSQT